MYLTTAVVGSLFNFQAGISPSRIPTAAKISFSVMISCAEGGTWVFVVPLGTSLITNAAKQYSNIGVKHLASHLCSS